MTRAPLDSFESALLSELRDVVTERSASQPRRRKPLLVAAAAAATVAASVGAVVFGLGTGGPAPASAAYSVSTQADGDIVVKIRRLDDADGLERALAERGITATVSYGGDVDDCVQFPVEDDEGPCSVPEEDISAVPDPAEPSMEATPVPDPGAGGTDPCGFGENAPSTLRRVDDGWTLTIPADSPLHDGVDLHVITQGGDADGAVLSTMFTKGDTGCGVTEVVE